MSKRVNFTSEEKYLSVKSIIEGRNSRSSESKRLGVSKSTVNSWLRKYELDGFSGLEESRTWKKYSAELKIKAVETILSGNESLESVVRLFNISSTSVLNRWVKKYTGNEELQSTSKGRTKHMLNTGRKTTFKERLEIVQYTLAHSKDYKKAIEKYHISYQQVYSWVRKFEEFGVTGLQDKRGRKKAVEELTEEERLKLRIKELEARNEQLEMEVAVRKKLKEVQDRYFN